MTDTRLTDVTIPFWAMVSLFIRAGAAALVAGLVLACVLGAVAVALFLGWAALVLLVGVV